jgi:hypothetical protein
MMSLGQVDDCLNKCGPRQQIVEEAVSGNVAGHVCRRSPRRFVTTELSAVNPDPCALKSGWSAMHSPNQLGWEMQLCSRVACAWAAREQHVGMVHHEVLMDIRAIDSCSLVPISLEVGEGGTLASGRYSCGALACPGNCSVVIETDRRQRRQAMA